MGKICEKKYTYYIATYPIIQIYHFDPERKKICQKTQRNISDKILLSKHFSTIFISIINLIFSDFFFFHLKNWKLVIMVCVIIRSWLNRKICMKTTLVIIIVIFIKYAFLIRISFILMLVWRKLIAFWRKLLTIASHYGPPDYTQNSALNSFMTFPSR